MTRAGGFTLIEVIIVLLIVSLAAGAVVLGTGAARGLQVEAQQLQQAIARSAQQSLMDGHARRLVAVGQAYGFERYVAGQWQAEGEPHALPAGMQLEGAGELRIYPDGSTSPFRLTLMDGEKRLSLRHQGDGMTELVQEEAL
jgi:general secretion pathway protein H